MCMTEAYDSRQEFGMFLVVHIEKNQSIVSMV